MPSGLFLIRHRDAERIAQLVTNQTETSCKQRPSHRRLCGNGSGQQADHLCLDRPPALILGRPHPPKRTQTPDRTRCTNTWLRSAAAPSRTVRSAPSPSPSSTVLAAVVARVSELPLPKIGDTLLATWASLATSLKRIAECKKWSSEVFKTILKSSQKISNGDETQ